MKKRYIVCVIIVLMSVIMSLITLGTIVEGMHPMGFTVRESETCKDRIYVILRHDLLYKLDISAYDILIPINFGQYEMLREKTLEGLTDKFLEK